MEAKDIGKVLGAAALATLPTVTGLYVYGKMKDKRQSTGASALVGGLTFTTLGIAVGLLNYYMFGLDETTAQIATLIGPKTDETAVAGLRGTLQPKYAFGSGSFMVSGLPVPERVYTPFTSNIRQVGYVKRRHYKPLGRVGCCGQ